MLEGLGLSEQDEALYLACIEHPGALPRDLGSATGQSVATVKTALRRLTAQGLLQGDDQDGYTPLPPEVAIESIVLVRQRALEQARAMARTLQHAFLTHSGTSAEVATVVNSAAETGLWWERLQLSATDEIVNFDAPPYLSEPPDHQLELQRLREGIRYRVVYSAAALSVGGRARALEDLRLAGERARCLPALPIKLAIADQKLALLPLLVGDAHGVSSALVVRESALLDILSLMFEQHWQRALPLDSPAAPPEALGDAVSPETEERLAREGGHQRDPLDQRVLTLLAAGLKDEAIARQLGVTVRTVRRRVQWLVTALDSATRFQAALQAQRRGWL